MKGYLISNCDRLHDKVRSDFLRGPIRSCLHCLRCLRRLFVTQVFFNERRASRLRSFMAEKLYDDEHYNRGSLDCPDTENDSKHYTAGYEGRRGECDNRD